MCAGYAIRLHPACALANTPDGFGNHFESEAVPDALPKLGNNPQKGPHGLYTECISGTAFTAPRHLNQRSWVYRVSPPRAALRT